MTHTHTHTLDFIRFDYLYQRMCNVIDAGNSVSHTIMTDCKSHTYIQCIYIYIYYYYIYTLYYYMHTVKPLIEEALGTIPYSRFCNIYISRISQMSTSYIN